MWSAAVRRTTLRRSYGDARCEDRTRRSVAGQGRGRLGRPPGEARREPARARTVHGRLSAACVVMEGEPCTSTGWLSDPLATPAFVGYRSPERAAGEGPSRRDDTWALAVTLYTALSGALPFPAESDQELRRKQGAGAAPRITPPGAAGDALWRVLDQALARGAEQRITEVAALRRALEAARPGDGLEELPPLDEHALAAPARTIPAPRPSSSGVRGRRARNRLARARRRARAARRRPARARRRARAQARSRPARARRRMATELAAAAHRERLGPPDAVAPPRAREPGPPVDDRRADHPAAGGARPYLEGADRVAWRIAAARRRNDGGRRACGRSGCPDRARQPPPAVPAATAQPPVAAAATAQPPIAPAGTAQPPIAPHRDGATARRARSDDATAHRPHRDGAAAPRARSGRAAALLAHRGALFDAEAPASPRTIDDLPWLGEDDRHEPSHPFPMAPGGAATRVGAPELGAPTPHVPAVDLPWLGEDDRHEPSHPFPMAPGGAATRVGAPELGAPTPHVPAVDLLWLGEDDTHEPSHPFPDGARRRRRAAARPGSARPRAATPPLRAPARRPGRAARRRPRRAGG